MFGLFKKKKKYFSAKVCFSARGMENNVIEGLMNEDYLVIVFFRETHTRLVEKLNVALLSEHILMADKVMSGHESSRIRNFISKPNKRIVLGERYPLIKHEEDLAEYLIATFGIATPIAAFCSLDDAILHQFGAERIKAMMQRMGTKEDEIIEHDMLESAIERAQEKISKQVIVESKTNSIVDWMKINYRTIK